MAPLNFFGELPTTNGAHQDVKFHTSNSAVIFTIGDGVTADVGQADDKKDSIIDVRIGKDFKTIYTLTTASTWPDQKMEAVLTMEDGFLTLRASGEDKVVHKCVFNKKL